MTSKALVVDGPLRGDVVEVPRGGFYHYVTQDQQDGVYRTAKYAMDFAGHHVIIRLLTCAPANEFPPGAYMADLILSDAAKETLILEMPMVPGD